ncbi:DUF2905 domain-containing protein [Acidihalobacter prosperus]
MARALIFIGIILILVGFFWPLIARLGFGRWPGDIFIHRGNFSFYFPLTTSIVISVIISLLIWFFKK